MLVSSLTTKEAEAKLEPLSFLGEKLFFSIEKKRETTTASTASRKTAASAWLLLIRALSAPKTHAAFETSAFAMNASIRRGPSRCLSGAGMPAGAAIRNNNIRVSAMSTTTTTTATRKRPGGLPATTTTLGLSSSPLLPGGARRRPLWTSSVVASAEGANGGNGGDKKQQQQQKQKQQQKQQQQRQQQKQPQQQQQKKKKEDKPDSPYKASVLLPETPFGMRANAVVREPELQKKWADEKTYERLLAKNKESGGGTFTLHDGPPYANGDAHLGHALNKILKSFVVNWKLLSGQQARYVPGWDCHGLPIELKVLQSLPESERRALSPEGLRAKAREFAAKTVDQQRSQFRRYGLFGDWDSPYMTLEPRYEAAQLRVFGALALGGHVYRGRKPVHWSPSSRTALAEAELEYPPGHVSRSVYVSLPVEALAERAAAAVEGQAKGTEIGERGIALAVWTTTAWTLPANAAVAVNERLSYSVVDLKDGGPLLVVAEALAGAVAAKVKKASAAGEGGEEENSSFEVLASFPGAALEGTTYRTPLDAPDPTNPPLRRVVVGGEYITTESGTGLVHTAPGHGQEDYGVGLRCGLPMPAPVDDAGKFTAEAGAGLEGLAVLKEGTAAVIDKLKESGNLLSEVRKEKKGLGGERARRREVEKREEEKDEEKKNSRKKWKKSKKNKKKQKLKNSTGKVRPQVPLRLAHQEADDLPRDRPVVRLRRALPRRCPGSCGGRRVGPLVRREAALEHGGGEERLVHLEAADVGRADPGALSQEEGGERRRRRGGSRRAAADGRVCGAFGSARREPPEGLRRLLVGLRRGAAAAVAEGKGGRV